MPEISFFIIILFFFHLHLLFHIDELNCIAKFSSYEFYYFRIQTLVNGYHDTKAHTLADHFGKTYIHQVGKLAYTDKFSYQQFVIIHHISLRIGCFLSFLPAHFCLQAFTATTGASQFSLGFPDLFLYLFFIYQLVLTAGRSCAPVISPGSAATPAIPVESAALFFVFVFINENIPLDLFLRYRNTLSFPALVFYRSCIAVNGQIYFAQDLGTG